MTDKELVDRICDEVFDQAFRGRHGEPNRPESDVILRQVQFLVIKNRRVDELAKSLKWLVRDW